MTILSLTFFRRQQEKSLADRPEPESPPEDSTGALGRLERMLSPESPPDETPVPTGSPADLGSAHQKPDETAEASLMPEPTAARDGSVVSVMAPPEEDEAEPQSTPVPTDNDAVATRAGLHIEPEASEPETSEEDVEVRLMAALDDARSAREARRLAEQEHDRIQQESANRRDRLEATLGDAIERAQTEVVLRRAAEIELERVQEESSRRVAEMQTRMEGLVADLSKATRDTAATVSATAADAGATTTKVKTRGTTKASKPRAARKPAGAARKKQSVTKTAPVLEPKTVKTAIAGAKRESIVEKAAAARR